MANRYMCTYHCGYSGTDDRHFLIATDEEQAAAYMEEGLYDYADGWTHLEFGWEGSYTDEEFEEFLQGCGYDIVEITDENEEEIFDEYGVDESDFEDIT